MSLSEILWSLTGFVWTLMGLSGGILPSGIAVGIGTVMLRDHAGVGGRAACADHGLVRRYLGPDGRIRDDSRLVALRDARRWPCGARVWIRLPRTGRRAEAIVADRGPAGVICPDGSRRLGSRREIVSDWPDGGCRWAALVDMTWAVHQDLGGDGYEWVVVEQAW